LEKRLLIKLLKSIRELPVTVARLIQFKGSGTSAVFAQTLIFVRSANLQRTTLTLFLRSENPNKLLNLSNAATNTKKFKFLNKKKGKDLK
jgi:hypothetical protein